MTAPAEHEHPISRGNLSAWAVAHPAVVLFFIIVFSVAGLMSYLSLGRAEDPVVHHQDHGRSRAAWPGATAEEMQDQVADKLEKRLQELELFDYVQTYTRPGVTVIQVQLKDTARQKEVDDAWYQVRKKLSDSRPTLPQGVQGPVLQRRVRRRLFRHLHAVGRRRFARQAQGLCGDRAPAPAAYARVSPRSTLSACASSASSSSSATASWRRSASRPRPSSTAWRARTR